MHNLKNNKATGEDRIANEYLKHSFDYMSDIYVKLFNFIFDTGLIPEQWLTGDVIPIFKNKGDKLDPQNFRPITIISCFGKLFTSILNTRLNEFSEEYRIICENQGGFRKGYSTIDNLFVLHTLIHIMKNKKKKLFCAFIDFAKAFDTVWRCGLWNKLLFNNINGKMYNVIFNMYSDIKSRIVYNGEKSEYFSCNVGVRQGENLSPFLFSIYLNDLENFLVSNNLTGLTCITEEVENELDVFIRLLILLYADDTVLLAESAVDLQTQLDNFYEYCRLWKLKVNIDKTKVVIFTSGRLQNNYNFTFNENNIEIVSDILYLGVNFSKSGSYQLAKKRNVNKAYKAMYEVLKKGRLHNLSIKCQYDLFDKIVKPTLLYGCELWGFTNLDIIERVHLKFCKLLLNLKKSTPNYMVYGELGAYPMSVSIKLRIVNYWSKLVDIDNNNKLSSVLYKYSFLKLSRDRCQMPWLKAVKEILDNCGFSYIWMNQNNINTKWLSLAIKQNLCDQFQQKWRSDIEDSSKGVHYRLFKDNLEFEPYLDLLEDKDRKLLCKLRTSNHRLPIETGRWFGIERENRICSLCDNLEIGDEFHFVLQCSFLQNERKEILGSFYSKRVNVLKYKHLFQSRNRTKLKNLCRLIKIIFSKVCPPG